jgi:hypothetical protein
MPFCNLAHCVGPDETALGDEGVDAIVDLDLGGIGSPFEKQDVIFIKLRFKVPFGLGYVLEQLRKCVPNPRLTSRCTSAGDNAL